MKYSLFLFIFIFSLRSSAQDTARVINKEVSFHKSRYFLYKNVPQKKAKCKFTKYEFDNGMTMNELVRLQDDQILYQHYYMNEKAVGTWKEYSEQFGLIDLIRTVR